MEGGPLACAGMASKKQDQDYTARVKQEIISVSLLKIERLFRCVREIGT